jgi:c-di-GMP-related signal transduction protein
MPMYLGYNEIRRFVSVAALSSIGVRVSANFIV